MIKLLNNSLIKIGSSSMNKDEILEEIASLVSSQCKDISKNEIFNGLKKREELSSTGVGNSLAIPHCAFEKVKDFYVGLLVVDGVDFQSIDNELVKLVFFSVGPKSEHNQHISTLTSISKIAMDKELLKKLQNAKIPSDVTTLLSLSEDEVKSDVVKCQIIIQVQDEKLFTDVLEILASDVDGSISVIDSETAGYYLHKIPLFSTFWNDVSDSFCKMIISVIDKRFMNETIRRINLAKSENKTGLLVTVNELLYFDGSLEY